MKSKTYTTIAFLVSVIAISGCATTNKNMSSFLGHRITEVVQIWGAPSSTFSEDYSAKTYTWEFPKGNAVKEQTCRKSFTTNLNGEIVSYSFIHCAKLDALN
jgi:hypothetical protein